MCLKRFHISVNTLRFGTAEISIAFIVHKCICVWYSFAIVLQYCVYELRIFLFGIASPHLSLPLEKRDYKVVWFVVRLFSNLVISCSFCPPLCTMKYLLLFQYENKLRISAYFGIVYHWSVLYVCACRSKDELEILFILRLELRKNLSKCI